jgi:capsular exopolysaccharide synthesis family protein
MIELKKFIIPLRKWWWLLFLTTFLAAGTSSYIYSKQPSVYEARTMLMIGRTIDDPNPSANAFTLSQQLAASYASLAHQDVVRSATLASLGIRRLPEFRASAIPNSQFIEIVVKDTNPELAQSVANELAAQLILQSPTSPDSEEQNRIEFINRQLDILETQISETQAEIDQLQNDLGNLTSALQITDTKNQISAQQTKLNTLQSNYSSLLANTMGGAINTLTIIEPANLPTRPVNSNGYITILLVSMAVLVLSASSAYLLEYLDNTIRSPEDIAGLVGKPVLGSISEYSKDGLEGFHIENYPDSPVADAFRLLRLNLKLSVSDVPPKSILVTSADEREGKTTIASNLARTIAHVEKKVILLDADLRKPSLHSELGLHGGVGLSDLIRENHVQQNIVHFWKNSNLAIITSGSPVDIPAELFISPKMDRVLSRLEQSADVVVIDGPPLAVVDATILASKVDGILLVIRPGYTSKTKVRAMIKQLERIGTPIIGIVLNRVTKKGVDYHFDYIYHESYYQSYKPQHTQAKGSTNGNGDKVSQRSWFFSKPTNKPKEKL